MQHKYKKEAKLILPPSLNIRPLRILFVHFYKIYGHITQKKDHTLQQIFLLQLLLVHGNCQISF